MIFEERRRYPRLDIKVVKISLMVSPLADDALEIFPSDIGLGGISFRTDRVLQLQDQLKLVLKFPSSEIPETTVAEVVWTHLSELLHDGSRIWYDTGVRFVDISEQCVQEIIRLVQNARIINS